MILIYLAGSIPFLASVWAVRGVNGKPVTRYRQLFLPVVALLYGIAALGFFSNINGLIQRLVALLGSFTPILSGLNTTFAVSCLFNCLFMLGFAVVKTVYRGAVALLEGPYEKVAERFYHVFYLYDEQYEHWYLRVEYHGVRRLFKAFYVVIVVLAVALFCAAGAWPSSPAFQNPFYPAFAVLLAGEVYFFLSGATKQEYLDEIEFDSDAAVRIFRYSKLQDALSHYFEDRLLHSFSRGRRKVRDASHTDFCEDLMHGKSFSARMAGAYFLALCNNGIIGKDASVGSYDELNHDVVLDTIRLLEGQSVMFASPFYRDYVPYLFLPVNAQLMRNNRVLFLYGVDGSEQEILSYAVDGLAFVNNVPNMWDIAPLKIDGSAKPDVGLLSFAELGDTCCILDNAAFFKEVGFVVVIDPSSLLATYQVGLSILAERLTEGRTPTYCIFDRNSDGLVDSLSHALRVHLVEVGATEYCEGCSVGMFWDVDGEFLQHRLFPDVAHYLGVGSEIGLVALKKQIGKVSWAAESSAPLADQRWILGQYYGEIFGFANISQRQLEVDERFEFFSSLWSMGKEDNRFIIGEDELCNLFESYRQFATRGTREAFVNVLAPNYLLRDYMVGNADLFAKDPKAIPSFAPDFSKSRRNAIFSLVMMMAQGERKLSEEEVRSRLSYVGISGRDVYETLVGLLVDQFEVDSDYDSALPENHIVVFESDEYVPEKRAIVPKRYYGLSNGAQYAGCFRLLRNVPLLTEEPNGAKLLLGSRLYGHVYQSILPGNYLTIRGKYYQVVSITDETGVVLRRAADHFSHRRYYRQLRTYSVNFWEAGEEPGESRSIAGIRLSHGSASVTVSTSGYLDLKDYGDLCNSRKVTISGIPKRQYRNKDVLRIDLDGAGAEATLTIAVLMSEFFRTLYPEDYQFIAVLTAFSSGLEEGILYGFKGECPESCIYIVEDSLVDIGLISSIDRNIERIFELCWDYLDWHLDMVADMRERENPWDTALVPDFAEPSKKKGPIARFVQWFKRHLRKSEADRGTEDPAESDSEKVTTAEADGAAEEVEGGDRA